MMADYRPGDLIIYRARDAFSVAKVDLVRECTLTCFLWTDRFPRFGRARHVIERARIESRLPVDADVPEVLVRLRDLSGERAKRRRAADNWLRGQIERLSNELQAEDA